MLELVTCSDPNELARNDVNLWNSDIPWRICVKQQLLTGRVARQ